jgi:PPOX class probable F420-dependent enzyme
MDDALKTKILEILAEHRIMTVATLRPDGWPQATTVGYASEGIALYFLCGLDSQKAANIGRDPRISITIDHDTPQVMEIAGLSMAARAVRVTDETEARRVIDLLFSRYPEQKSMPFPMPKPEDVCIVRAEPVVISVLDYTKGFAHTDLVSC